MKMNILLAASLAFLSKRPFEFGIFFAAIYLLRSQAGGIEFPGKYGASLRLLTLWGFGRISYRLLCPLWLQIPLLLLANATIYLFAPAKSQRIPQDGQCLNQAPSCQTELLSYSEEAYRLDVEKRRQAKNRAVFVTGILSLCSMVARGTSLSTLLLLALLSEAALVLGVIWEALSGNEEKPL